MSVARAMCRADPRRECRGIVARRRHRDLIPLPAEPAVDKARHRGIGERGCRRPRERLEGLRELAIGQIGQRAVQRAEHVDALRRRGQPQGTQHAGMRRHHDARHSQGVRQCTPKQRPGAAERQQRHPTRIDPARHTDALQHPRHHRGGHLDYSGGDLADIVRQRQSRERALGGGPVEAHRVRERVQGIEPAQHKAGVGDGWLNTAAAVAGRAWVRPGAARADPQRAALVHCRNAPAACAHRLDQDRRQGDRHTGDRLGTLGQRDAAADHTRVGARAAHVEREEIPGAHGRTDEPCAHDPAGGTGERETRRAPLRLRGAERSPARRHDEERAHATLAARRRRFRDVRRHLRSEVGLSGGRAGPLVFPEDRQDFMTRRHGNPWQCRA